MNFLFTTVLVLLLVAPGLVFFRTYYAGPFSIRYSNLTITDQVFRSIVPGLLIQAILFWAIQTWGGPSTYVRLDILGNLLMGVKEDKTVQAAFTLLRLQLGTVLLYYIAVLSAGGLLGWASRRLVRWRKWDRHYLWLRYDNQWHYLLTGEILETPEARAVMELRDASHIDFVLVDILMKLEKSNTIYSGILAGYELGPDGGLRTIYLREAQRKTLNTETLPQVEEPAAEVRPAWASWYRWFFRAAEHVSSTEASASNIEEIDTVDEYYNVEGHLMIIPYSQLLNLNLTYFIDEDDAQAEGDVASEAGPEFRVNAVNASGTVNQPTS